MSTAQAIEAIIANPTLEDAAAEFARLDAKLAALNTAVLAEGDAYRARCDAQYHERDALETRLIHAKHALLCAARGEIYMAPGRVHIPKELYQ